MNVVNKMCEFDEFLHLIKQKYLEICNTPGMKYSSNMPIDFPDIDEENYTNEDFAESEVRQYKI